MSLRFASESERLINGHECIACSRANTQKGGLLMGSVLKARGRRKRKMQEACAALVTRDVRESAER